MVIPIGAMRSGVQHYATEKPIETAHPYLEPKVRQSNSRNDNKESAFGGWLKYSEAGCFGHIARIITGAALNYLAFAVNSSADSFSEFQAD
jgi:hypothetical protein